MSVSDIRKGWVFKQSGAMGHPFKKKFAVLQSNYLLLFDKESESMKGKGKAKKQRDVTDCVVRIAEGIREHGFTVEMPRLKKKNVLVLAGLSAADRQRWMDWLADAARPPTKPAPPPQPVYAAPHVPGRYEPYPERPRPPSPPRPPPPQPPPEQAVRYQPAQININIDPAFLHTPPPAAAVGGATVARTSSQPNYPAAHMYPPALGSYPGQPGVWLPHSQSAPSLPSAYSYPDPTLSPGAAHQHAQHQQQHQHPTAPAYGGYGPGAPVNRSPSSPAVSQYADYLHYAPPVPTAPPSYSPSSSPGGGNGRGPPPPSGSSPAQLAETSRVMYPSLA